MWSCPSTAATSLSRVTGLFNITLHVSCLSPQIAISLGTLGLSMRNGILRPEHSYIFEKIQTDTKEMAIHSSILAWRIPWTEEPGRLQSMGLQKSWTQLSLSMHTHTDFIIRLSPCLALCVSSELLIFCLLILFALCVS